MDLTTDLMKTVQAYLIPLLFLTGALLAVVGLLIRQLAVTHQLKVRGNTFTGYGVLAMLLAVALYVILWVVEAWSREVIGA
jgi:hypothetical protein